MNQISAKLYKDQLAIVGTDPGQAFLIYVVRRRGRLAPRQPLSVCTLLPA